MGGIVSGLFGGGSAATDAASIQAQATQAGIGEQRRQFDITQGNLDPFLQAGTGALQTQQALLGQLGPEAAAAAQAQFMAAPGQQAAQERAQKNLLQNAAATGGLGGANTRTALVQQGVDFSNLQFGDFQNRLAGLSGTGQTAATNLGQLGGQTASNISGLLQAGGQAQASGILGAQQANAGLAGQVLGTGLGAAAGGGLFGSTAAGLFGGSGGAGALIGLLSDVRLKKNLVKVGELPSGLNWFDWEWTEEGLKLSPNQATSGVLAHEAKEIFPDAVTECEDGYSRVDYKRLH